MIAYIEGKIIDFVQLPKQSYIVLMTNSGIGYKVFVLLNSIFNVGDDIKMYTSFQVREDSQNLFGFLYLEQREMFENILNVSGIGPKVALAVVSNFTSQEFQNILLSADYNSLSKVQGLGQKGAKKIVLELQGIYVQDEIVSSEDEIVFKELKSAFQALGFKGKELDKLVEKGKREYNERDRKMSIENLISFVLKND